LKNSFTVAFCSPFCCEKALFQENRYKVTIIILNINDLL